MSERLFRVQSPLFPLFLGFDFFFCVLSLQKGNRACLIQHSVQLIPGLPNTISIVAIYHKDEPLCVLEVVPP